MFRLVALRSHLSQRTSSLLTSTRFMSSIDKFFLQTREAQEQEKGQYRPQKKKKPRQLSKRKEERTKIERDLYQNPNLVLMNASRLTEPQLYSTLKATVEMPQGRFRKMMSQKNQEGQPLWDSVFVGEVIQRLPYFLSLTVIDIAHTLQTYSGKHSSYILSEQAHPLWVALEKEFIKRATQFDNDTLLKFYYEMEELLIDSELPLDPKHIKTALQAYARVDMGSGIFYKNLIDHMQRRLKHDFTLMEKVSLAATIANCTNVHAGCYGLMGDLEEQIKQEIDHKRLYFNEATRIACAFFPQNLGSNELQEMLEQRIFCTWDISEPKHADQILRMVKKTSGYYFRSSTLLKQIQDLIGETLASQSIKRSQIEQLFWAVCKERRSCFSRNLKYQILGRMDTHLPSFKMRTIAFMTEGVANIYEDQVEQTPPLQFQSKQHSALVHSQFKDIVRNLDDAIQIKQHQLKNPHDAVKLIVHLVRMSKAYVPSQSFELLVAAVFKEPKSVKYADALHFFQVLLQKLPYIAQRNLSNELWLEFEKDVFSPVLKKMPASNVARLLELVQIIGYSSQEFISELAELIQQMAYDFNNQDFSKVAAGLLEIGGVEEFKRAITPIITDLLHCEAGFGLISTQKNYDKRSRISFQSQDQEAKQRAMLNVLWSVFALRKIDPTSTVAKRLYIAMDLKVFQETFQNLKIQELTFEEYLKLAQIVQINQQLNSGKRAKSRHKGGVFSVEWLKNRRKQVKEEVVMRWVQQDRLTPSPQALEILTQAVRKEGAEDTQSKVIDFFGNQFHSLIARQNSLTAINIIPKRIYLGEESKRRAISETLREELIREQGIELREIEESEVLLKGEALQAIVRL